MNGTKTWQVRNGPLFFRKRGIHLIGWAAKSGEQFWGSKNSCARLACKNLRHRI